MTPEQQAAFIIAKAVCAMAEIAGMQAENLQRQTLGLSVAYGEDAFNDVVLRNGIGHNDVLGLFLGS